ncbi:hypothetical protein EMCRGX_G026738 [Ephydatia muelleri]
MYEGVDDDDSACEEVDDVGTEVACDLLEIPGNDGDRGPGDKVTIPSLTLTWSKGLHSASCSASEELNVLQSSLGRRHSKVIPSHAINTKDEDERVKAISANPSTAETYFVRAEVYEKVNLHGSTTMSSLRWVDRHGEQTRVFQQRSHRQTGPAQVQTRGEVPPHSTSLTAEDGPQRHHGTQPQVQGPIQPGEDVAVLEWWGGRAGHYTEALQDFAAIHLEPAGAQAFYQRTCLLGSMFPKHSLRDYSTSLLLDDSNTNVQTYMNNLYAQMKWTAHPNG